MQYPVHYYATEKDAQLPANFEIKLLASDCQFSEGPLWHNDGYYLFSDIPANCIYKITEEGKKEIWQQPSGFTGNDAIKEKLAEQIGSNGLAQTKSGEVFICQHGNGAIAVTDGEHVKTFIAGFNGKRFNSPNDIVAATNRTVFFTDPPYGLKDAQLQPDWAQPVAGVYCWRNEKIELFSTDYQYPNGVCLSADEQKLYVCSNKPFEKFITVFDANILKKIKVLATENSDGIKCDGQGRLWLCTKEGIVVISENTGERLFKIELPTVPANICFGGAEKKDALVTARGNIFLLKNINA